MHSILSVTWMLGTSLEVLIVCCVLHKRAYKAWPSLLFYCCWDLAGDVALSHFHSPWGHFYVYWGWYLGSSIMRFWIISDVIRAFPGFAFLRGSLLFLLLPAYASILGGASWVAYRSFTRLPQQLIAFSHILDQCLAFALTFILIATLAVIWFQGIGWSRRGAGIVSGLALKLAASLFTSQLLSTPATRGIGGFMQAAAAVITLLLWLRVFWQRDENLQLPPILQHSFGTYTPTQRKTAS